MAWRLGFYRGSPIFMSAISGIDIALWDLKRYRLVYAWIGGDRPADIGEAAKARQAQGFKAIKMNATEDTVKALGMDAALDFHGRLHKPMVKQLAKALEPHRPLSLEEPLLSENLEGIKQLSEQVSCPITLGERLYSRWDVKRFLEDGSVDILQPDISHCGGISELRRIANNIAIAPHCPLGPIALTACMQAHLSIPNFVI
ncbi:hypothetical protein N7508_009438 [Penicillium antarcticum]|uniref:uncharacterized protein n=1 Tax=Penicillium antarcticum TaxID=416450 RepID=UPI00238A8057|nr:uncharacterized protein N7508_009438 [Penicillium antarcticum]KAJ5294617.1 hypothetical protein N7508_009438 [Penicillium antarcticum]